MSRFIAQRGLHHDVCLSAQQGLRTGGVGNVCAISLFVYCARLSGDRSLLARSACHCWIRSMPVCGTKDKGILFVTKFITRHRAMETRPIIPRRRAKHIYVSNMPA